MTDIEEILFDLKAFCGSRLIFLNKRSDLKPMISIHKWQ